MSKKKTQKKTDKKSEKRTRKRTRFFATNKLVLGVLIIVVILVIVAGCIGYYFNNIKMDEIPTDDEQVATLATRYFRGTSACLDYNLGIFSDGTVNAKDLSYDTKEEIVIDYAVRKGYDKIGFNELKEVYNLLFNDGSTLQEKYYYESTSGAYEKIGDAYELNTYSACSAARPLEMICQVIDKAYKSDREIKIITGLYSGTADTQNLYSGLNWDDEHLLGVFGEIEEPTADNLAKWEIVYKYNDKLKTYYLDHTKKL